VTWPLRFVRRALAAIRADAPWIELDSVATAVTAELSLALSAPVEPPAVSARSTLPVPAPRQAGRSRRHRLAPGLTAVALAVAGFTQMATATSAAADGTAGSISKPEAGGGASFNAAPTAPTVPATASLQTTASTVPAVPTIPAAPTTAAPTTPPTTPAATPRTTPTVTITKANNASGTGYGTSETAADGITSVPYQVVVTNPNAQAGTITVLTDTADGSTINLCPNLVGKVLQPFGQANDSATCDFTGPVPTSPTTDTASTTLSVSGALATATATSTVFPPVFSPTVVQTPPAATPTAAAPAAPTPAAVGAARLATTGAPVRNLLTWALALLLGGAGLLGGLFVTDPRRRLALIREDAGPEDQQERGAQGSAGSARFPRYPVPGPLASTPPWSTPARRTGWQPAGGPQSLPWATTPADRSPPGSRPSPALHRRGPLPRHRHTGWMTPGGRPAA